MFDPELLKQWLKVPVHMGRGGRNLLFYIALRMEEYNPVHLNPFGLLPPVALLIYTTGSNLPKLDILMNACERLYCFTMVFS
jgi:hypothetical protein